MKFFNNLFSLIKEGKDFGSIGIAEVIGAIISSGFWFYLASIIEPSEYGEIHFILSIGVIASTLSILGNQNSITVLVAKGKEIQSTISFISLSLSLITSTIIILIFNKFDFGVIIIAYVINTIAIGELIGKKQFMNYSKYLILQKVLTLIIGLGFLHFFGSEGIIYGLSLTYSLYLIIIVRIFKNIPINFKLIKQKFNFLVSGYGLNLVTVLEGQIDKIIILPVLGGVILGNYSLALQMISIFTIIMSVMSKILLSRESTGEDNKSLIKKFLIFSGFLTALVFMFSPIITSIFFSKYEELQNTIQVMGLSIIIYAINVVIMSKLLAREKSFQILFSGIISLIISIVGVFTLGIIFGTFGMGITYVISLIAQCIFLLICFKGVNNE